MCNKPPPTARAWPRTARRRSGCTPWLPHKALPAPSTALEPCTRTAQAWLAQDFNEAVRLYTLAAAQGDAKA
jgi:hypothetical protein